MKKCFFFETSNSILFQDSENDVGLLLLCWNLTALSVWQNIHHIFGFFLKMTFTFLLLLYAGFHQRMSVFTLRAQNWEIEVFSDEKYPIFAKNNSSLVERSISVCSIFERSKAFDRSDPNPLFNKLVICTIPAYASNMNCGALAQLPDHKIKVRHLLLGPFTVMNWFKQGVGLSSFAVYLRSSAGFVQNSMHCGKHGCELTIVCWWFMCVPGPIASCLIKESPCS